MMLSLAHLVKAEVAHVAVRTLATAAFAHKTEFLKHSNPFPASFDHTPLLSTLPETKVTTLPNGLRVASQTMPYAETATVGLWINSGSRFETDENNGVAHFLEHLLFKGTKRRTVRELELEIENMGGHLNAYTGREQTCYYAKVMGRDIQRAVDILSDILLNSNLEERAIEREKDVILREMEEVNKQNSEVVFDHLHATAFQTTPLGRTILGPVDNIRAMNRDMLVNYMKTHYRGQRMVLAAAGSVNHDELVKFVTDMLGGVPSEDAGMSVKELIKKEPSIWTGSDVHDQREDVTELCFAAAFKGASWTDPDSVALMVMQTMLGAWDRNSTVGHHSSSPLVKTWATYGVGDAVMAFNTNYHDAGLFGVYGVTSRERGQDAAKSVMNEMTRMCYEVSEQEVVRARNQLKASMMFMQDSTHHVAESIGRELLVYDRILPKAELFARIDAVDAKAIRGVADRFIYNKDVAVTAVGDTQQFVDYNGFKQRTSWVR